MCAYGRDLARMYDRYSQKIGWTVQPVGATEADLGGFEN